MLDATTVEQLRSTLKNLQFVHERLKSSHERLNGSIEEVVLKRRIEKLLSQQLLETERLFDHVCTTLIEGTAVAYVARAEAYIEDEEEGGGQEWSVSYFSVSKIQHRVFRGSSFLVDPLGTQVLVEGARGLNIPLIIDGPTWSSMGGGVVLAAFSTKEAASSWYGGGLEYIHKEA